MQVKWRRLLNKKTVFWLVSEIWLNSLGLDKLAAYSEYIFDRDLELYKKNHISVKIYNYPPTFCTKVDAICPIPIVKPDNSDLTKDVFEQNIFKTRCKKLQHPCMKVLSVISSCH